MDARLGVLLGSLLLVAPAHAQTEGSEEPAYSPMSGGAQFALDGHVSEPMALSPQLGGFLHLRPTRELAIRILGALAYVPMDGRPYPGPEPTEHRFMMELRVGAGWRIMPELEGRLFLSGRLIQQLVPGNPPVMFEGILLDSGRTELWETYLTLSGGTEWTVRPDPTMGLELSASLGIGGLGRTRPDGSFGFGSDVVGHGAVSVGWIFE